LAVKLPKVRGVRSIKKDILKLFERYVRTAEDLESLTEGVMPGIMNVALCHYRSTIEEARDAEVLNMTAVLVDRVGVSFMLHPLVYEKNIHINASFFPSPPATCFDENPMHSPVSL
jgi:CRM1 C terminal